MSNDTSLGELGEEIVAQFSPSYVSRSKLSEFVVDLWLFCRLLNSYFVVSAAGRFANCEICIYLSFFWQVVVFYDYFLTFPLELSQVWRGRLNIMKILFAFNRYFGLVFMCLDVLFLVKPASDTVGVNFYYLLWMY